MAPDHRLPPKRDVAEALLQHSSLFIHIDPRGEAVRVPAWFKKQPQLVLQVGLNMAVPIPDLHVDDEGVTCTLSFSRSPFFCSLPWPAIYALVGEDGRGMVWPDDVPPEVAVQRAEEGASPGEKSKEQRDKRAAREKARAHLRAVPRAAEAEGSPGADDETAEAGDPDENGRPQADESATASDTEVATAGERGAKSGAARGSKVRAAPVAAAPEGDEQQAGKATRKSNKSRAKTRTAASTRQAAAEADAASEASGQHSTEESATPEASAGGSAKKLPPYLRVVK